MTTHMTTLEHLDKLTSLVYHYFRPSLHESLGITAARVHLAKHAEFGQLPVGAEFYDPTSETTFTKLSATTATTPGTAHPLTLEFRPTEKVRPL
jgi:hypothetical protein